MRLQMKVVGHQLEHPSPEIQGSQTNSTNPDRSSHNRTAALKSSSGNVSLFFSATFELMYMFRKDHQPSTFNLAATRAQRRAVTTNVKSRENLTMCAFLSIKCWLFSFWFFYYLFSLLQRPCPPDSTNLVLTTTTTMTTDHHTHHEVVLNSPKMTFPWDPIVSLILSLSKCGSSASPASTTCGTYQILLTRCN